MPRITARDRGAYIICAILNFNIATTVVSFGGCFERIHILPYYSRLEVLKLCILLVLSKVEIFFPIVRTMEYDTAQLSILVLTTKA
jgi:hypothetical protein